MWLQKHEKLCEKLTKKGKGDHLKCFQRLALMFVRCPVSSEKQSLQAAHPSRTWATGAGLFRKLISWLFFSSFLRFFFLMHSFPSCHVTYLLPGDN